jgi:hypothetical protein
MDNEAWKRTWSTLTNSCARLDAGRHLICAHHWCSGLLTMPCQIAVGARHPAYPALVHVMPLPANSSSFELRLQSFPSAKKARC